MSSMKSKNFVFAIERCNSENAPPGVTCKSDEEIDAFAEDIQIDSWVISEKMDFHKYDDRPVFRTMENKGTFLLKHDIVPNQMVFLRTHSFATEDSWLRIGQKTFTGEFY